MDRTVNSIISEYAKQIYAELSPKAVYLYGSFAKGIESEYSDIDVAVVVNPIPAENYLKIAGRLWEIAARFDGRIEPNLIIDDGEDDRFSMLHEVVNTGQLIR